MKRLSLAAAAIFSGLMQPALAQPHGAMVPRPPASAAQAPVAMLAQAGTGQVLYARRPDLRFVPASVTKVMSAYVAFDMLDGGRLRTDQAMVVRSDTFARWHGQGTSMGLRAGERVPARALLQAMMTVSANDAAVVLAEGAAGSVPAWTAAMNAAARRLGMRNSHFATPNGWPDNGATYVTARDLVTLGNALVHDHPDFYRAYVGRRAMTWNGVSGVNRDPLLGRVAGADGIKTGHTREAGFNFLGSVERGGRRLLVVVAGAPDEATRLKVARDLVEWGFSAWHGRLLWPAGAKIGAARVQGGASRSVNLAASYPVWFSTSSPGTKIFVSLKYRGPLVAPIRQGDEVARLVIVGADGSHAEAPLIAAEAVAVAGPLDRLWNGLIDLLA